ncbi:ABC transporter substrate-binding protein [Cohnella faecalis]|uniref:ABC transporter substrate-binding protein n=1 Tax=Cohnella faecalis TaxID=2315694 RepID=A0A398CJU0_9BACL|nr:ABC transporter substrate-binding protein [Cohnella faecalis]RIE02963.1 ABC transporter substrate-binding protein [Cohnella faecalis]
MKNLFFAALLFVIITTSACGNNTNSTNDAAGKPSNGTGTEQASAGTDKPNDQELIVAGQEIAASLDPVQPLTSSYLRNIGAAEALFIVNAEGKVEPSLAESATEVDPTTWEIKLRPEARFWSGKAIDADAVIASLERSKALDLQAKPFLEELTFAKADDYTLRVKTKRSHLSVPLNLSYYQTVIHNTAAKHDAVPTMDLSGMYKVTEFIPKQKLVLEKNESYWGKKPKIQRVVYEEISEEQTRVLSVLSGRSQVALNISPSSLAQLKDSKEAVLSAVPAANTQTIYLNLSRPQLKDVRVRQALSWGLNREDLVILAAEGQSFPVSTWLSSNPAYAEARNAVYAKFDPEEASRLLDEAGWKKGSDGIRYKDGKPLTLRLMTWGGDKALGEALQNQWTGIGVKAEVQHGDYSLIETARESGDWDASIEAWSTFGDELSLLTGQYAPEGRANYGGYNDEETNQWLSQLAEASDEAARHSLALKINERVAQQAPVISLFPRPQISAISSKLHGFKEHFRQFENVVNADLTLDSK